VQYMIYQIINDNIITFCIFVFFIGACLASFFNVYSLRYMRIIEKKNAQEVFEWFNEMGVSSPVVIVDKMNQAISLSFPSSHCGSCKTPLRWYHNIPIISWCILRGRCGFCGAEISKQYPIVEFFGGVLAVVCTYLFYIKNINSSQEIMHVYLAMMFFTFVTYLLMVIDWKTMFLPDELNYVLLWAGLLFIILNINPFGITLEEAVVASMLSYLLFWTIATVGRKLKGCDVMGSGDLKLVAAISTFIGISGVASTIFLASFIGILFWFISGRNKGAFPFGPSLIFAAWINVCLLALLQKDVVGIILS